MTESARVSDCCNQVSPLQSASRSPGLIKIKVAHVSHHAPVGHPGMCQSAGGPCRAVTGRHGRDVYPLLCDDLGLGQRTFHNHQGTLCCEGLQHWHRSSLLHETHLYRSLKGIDEQIVH